MRNSCILWNDPTPPISDESAIISEPRGSVSRVKRDRDVNTVAVSKLPPPFLFLAIIEKTAKAKIGDTIGDM